MVRVSDTLINQQLSSLKLNREIYEVLINNNINLVNDLWILNRKKLKEFGLKDGDINHIIIKLELVGLELNRKVNN